MRVTQDEWERTAENEQFRVIKYPRLQTICSVISRAFRGDLLFYACINLCLSLYCLAFTKRELHWEADQIHLPASLLSWMDMNSQRVIVLQLVLPLLFFFGRTLKRRKDLWTRLLSLLKFKQCLQAKYTSKEQLSWKSIFSFTALF